MCHLSLPQFMPVTNTASNSLKELKQKKENLSPL